MANYAIGDIQGCYHSFCNLLEKINFKPDKDKLWLAGDLVNRGPDSLSTLRKVYELAQQECCETVLGNHDLHMLAVYYGFAERKPKDNFFDVLDAPDAEQLLHWLQTQALVKEINIGKQTYLLSHAGIPPIWSKAQALTCANEVERLLASENAQRYFEHMYGNSPDQWHESLQGFDRLRMITNYFTRMRFCDQQGKLEMDSKGSSDDKPEGFKPWFEFENAGLDDTKILFGHWAALEGKTNKDNLIALDTGCVWGGCLTALRLEDQQRIQVTCS